MQELRASCTPLPKRMHKFDLVEGITKYLQAGPRERAAFGVGLAPIDSFT